MNYVTNPINYVTIEATKRHTFAEKNTAVHVDFGSHKSSAIAPSADGRPTGLKA